MQSLVDYVREQVSPRQYFEALFSDLRWPSSGTEGRVCCTFHHDSKTPSLSLNPDNGKWFCHGCGVGGNSIVSFEQQLAKPDDLSKPYAAQRIYERFVHPVIPPEQIERWHKALLATPSALRYLHKDRLLEASVISKFKLGWNGKRIVVPMQNEFGLYVVAKLHDPLYKEHNSSKWTFHRFDSPPGREVTHPVLIYPMQVLLDQSIQKLQIEEGEFDALFQLGMQQPSVTTTNGSRSWPKQYNELFRGKTIVLGGDNDAPGEKYRTNVQHHLGKLAKSILARPLTPVNIGKDCTDWARRDENARKPKFWADLIDKSKLLLDNPEAVYSRPELQNVPLGQASNAIWTGKRIEVSAVVSGKSTAPYILPRRVRVTCERSCDACPLGDSDKAFREITFEPNEPDTLEMINVTKNQLKKKIYVRGGGFADKPECKCRIQEVEMFNVEELALIPTLETSNGQYTVRNVFYVGHGIRTNRGYCFEGTTLPDPTTQHATHLFDTAKSLQDEIDTFTLSTDLRERLKVFRPRGLGLLAHVMAIADWQSRHVTRIRERPDLHVAVDLAYHSVSAFEFNGELVSRGMLDVLVIGDTRCGKGYVTEGLRGYYNLGEIASGENCSFAGLVGGVQQVNKRWFITWGVIPLNNGRLVVIDEASSLDQQDFSKLSRVRSEGVAEISKIVRESTRANTRLIWLSNPRSGRAIGEYNSGLEAVKELVGANEDVARFDFVLTVATNEVPAEVINMHHHPGEDADKYPQDVCRALVLWAWSRRPDQIQFTKEAETEIIESAIQFGKMYSPAIPLVQAENIRVKIAKISVALAARVFSADETGEILVVTEHHVKAACQYLRIIYAKPAMAYDTYSENLTNKQKIQSVDAIAKVFDKLAGDRRHAIEGIVNSHRFTADMLADYLGDLQSARAFLSELVKLNCIERRDQYYYKSQAFKSWLINAPEASPNGSTNGARRSNGDVPKRNAAQPTRSSNGQAH